MQYTSASRVSDIVRMFDVSQRRGLFVQAASPLAFEVALFQQPEASAREN